MTTAFRVSHVRLGNILERCRCLHGCSCQVCQKLKYVEVRTRSRSLETSQRHPLTRWKHSSSDNSSKITVTPAQVQNADHWARIRGTVSGIRATVGNITQAWRSSESAVQENKAAPAPLEEIQALKTDESQDVPDKPQGVPDQPQGVPDVTPDIVNKIKDTQAASQAASQQELEIHIGAGQLEPEVNTGASKLESEIKTGASALEPEINTGASHHVYMTPDEHKEKHAKWVQQILDIQDKHDREQIQQNTLMMAKENSASVIEKLDDPLAQTNTEVPNVPGKFSFVGSDIYNRMTFSYFSKAKTTAAVDKGSDEIPPNQNQSSSDTKDPKSPDMEKTPAATSNATSTINRLKNAVTFSRKNKSSSILAAKKKERLPAVDALTKHAVEPKASKATEADNSYWNMLSNLQQNILLSLSLTSSSSTKTPAEMHEHIARNIMHSELESESAFVQRTSSLSENLLRAESTMSKLKRLDELCLHLIQHPQFRHIAVKHKVIPCLFEMCESGHPKLMSKAHEALALCGNHRPPKGRGIRMIAIDGGGTRGLIAIETLQRLERLMGEPVNQMFDFVIGTSTGALLASLIFLTKVPLDECKELYLDRSAKMFVKESLLSKTKNLALHDVSIFEEIVKAEVGEATLASSSRDPTTPRMAMTSTLSNVPKWKTFLFRNYNHRPGVISDYRGTCNLKIWQAIRASGSAPIYYSPFQIGEHIFRDGGCLANNPTAVGIHECKLLWPHESFQCILSVGNGKYDPSLNKLDNSGYNVIPRSMKDLADGIIDSATDTEGVHLILKNTLDPDCYFRFSPYLKEQYPLSEVNPARVKAMLSEADAYMDKNEHFMQKLVARLKQERLPNQKLADFTQRRRQTHNYLLF